MRKIFFVIFLSFFAIGSAEDDGYSLFNDLALVHKIDKEISDTLPFYYNFSLMGGYYNMPSARMAPEGTLGVGGGRVPPYNIYGVNFQMFNRIELAGNYRVFSGIEDAVLGKHGFGDEAERSANIKIGVLAKEDGFRTLPYIAFGAEDFIGTKRFTSKYVVATKEWLDWNLETTLGWGKGRIKGWFGGVAWSPFRHLPSGMINGLSFLAEWDAINYKKHQHEHPWGRKVKSRVNVGLSYLIYNTLQVSLSTVRGDKLAGSATLRYPLGTSKGIFPKIDDPKVYKSPVDTEPLGVTRPKEEFSHELAYALGEQGLELYSVFLSYNEQKEKELWIKVINNRYREETTVRSRLQHVLAALMPSDIVATTVVVEADGIPCQSYVYRTQDLNLYRMGKISGFELETLAPMREAISRPSDYDAARLFHRRKSIWSFTFFPRLLSYFGSASGKFKYTIGMVAFPEGYLFDDIYYKFQVSYAINSSMTHVGFRDLLNPSKLVVVRTDSIKYFHTNTVSIEQGYLQKSWTLGKGWFARLAGGYFESAYGGLSTELLYYPIKGNWAIGLEGASVLKRRYQGLAFTRKALKEKDGRIAHVPFVGIQYFLDFYYHFKPLSLDFKVTVGQFLAKDKGVRTEVIRYFKSGARFSLWCTVTNAHDIVNGKNYFDKGFSFSVPLDMFMKKSSRNYISYAMSAWLRDNGAIAESGRKLYGTIREERY